MSRTFVFISMLFSTLILQMGCSTERSALSENIPCNSDQECNNGFSCFLNTCIEDGSLSEGDTCTTEIQCGDGLICYGSVCINGCRDIYHQGHCPDGQWCQPEDHRFVEDSFGIRSYVGTCATSECAPSSSSECADDKQCLQVTSEVGACIQGCSYSFTSGAYEDSCEMQDDLPHSCQIVGEDRSAGCLPSGPADGPAIGFVGCDTISRPCRPGFLCVNVVCRRLCSAAEQTSPCPVGESCVSVAQGHPFSFCKAD